MNHFERLSQIIETHITEFVENWHEHSKVAVKDGNFAAANHHQGMADGASEIWLVLQDLLNDGLLELELLDEQEE